MVKESAQTGTVVDRLVLSEPSEELKDAYIEFIEEIHATGEPFHQEYREVVRKDFARFLRARRYLADGVDLPEDMVPQTDYWLVSGGTRIVATSRLRRRLTPALEVEGGHIGFDVRPSERGKGFATLIMALTMAKAREAGLTRILVTCDKDNIASARVIEKNRGRPGPVGVSPVTGKEVQVFWINL